MIEGVSALLASLLGPVSQIVTPPPIVPSGNATRFDIIMSQSAVAPGGTASGKLYPNSGLWSGGTVTLTRASGAAVNVALPSNGNAAVAFSFTSGSAGEELLTATNTAGLRNPAPHPMSVFAAGSGAAATISIGSLPGTYIPQRTFQQCVWSGAPSTFAGVGGVTLANGWGRVKIPITGTVSALFGRLTNADSAGATSSGGGTVISTIAQVYGPISGSANAALLLPTSDYCVYLDLASDAAFTNPVRVPLPFFIRDVMLVVTRSQENMLLGSYAAGIPGNTNWSSYQKTTAIGSQNPSNSGYEIASGAWLRVDGTQSYGNYGAVYGGVGAQELGRMFAAKKGTGLGILGLVPAGGNLDDFWAEDGSPCNSAAALLGACDQECRYLVFEGNGWSGTYATESAAEYRKVYQAIPGKMMARNPSLAVVSGNSASGMFGQDGSRTLGYSRENTMIRALEMTDPCVTAAEAGADWNEYYSNSGHASWASAIRYARSRARSVLLSEGAHAGGFGRGYSDRYAVFSAAGSMAAGSGVIKVPFSLPAGATKLVALQWQNGTSRASDWVYTTPTAAKLAQLVTVYQGAGQMYVGTSDPVVPVTGVTIDNTVGTLNIAVATTVVAPLTVQILADFGRSTGGFDGTTWVGIFDDRDLGDACGYGPGVRPQLNIAVS